MGVFVSDSARPTFGFCLTFYAFGSEDLKEDLSAPLELRSAYCWPLNKVLMECGPRALLGTDLEIGSGLVANLAES